MRREDVGRIVGLVVLATIATALLALSSLPRGGTQTVNVRPEYIPETYVDFTCYHSEITLNGTVACHDGTSDVVACEAPIPPLTCVYAMKDIPDTGYIFGSWTHSGSVHITGTGASVTLKVFVPGTGKYQGDVTATVR
jgi:hypothetical protein